MFERNKIDNSLQQASVPAEVTLDDGRTLKGKFHVAAARSIYDVLNGETCFLDFETHDGDRAMIAKSTLKAVKIVSVAPAGGIAQRMRQLDAFEPYAILGLERGATWEDVRAAYLKLSKTYHPDRFAGIELPGEVSEYLAQMARRVNAAYGALEVPHQTIRRAEIEKAKPIFTSGQRL